MSNPEYPEGHMGVFKDLESVPDRYRFQNFTAEYAGRDVWDEYMTEQVYELHPDLSETTLTRLNRAERRWKEHMNERGRHHALATPADVEAFCESLGDISLETAYGQYWQRIEGMYSWLQSHTEHPHVYHPVFMAAAEYPNAREIWDHRIARTTHKNGVNANGR